jgi:TetR/AcrR family transcriptional regulator
LDGESVDQSQTLGATNIIVRRHGTGPTTEQQRMPRIIAKAGDPRVRARQNTLRGARRQIVIDAARRVFERVGLEGASIRLIAAEAGCTTGAIYPWFAGKEEVYAAILAESLDSLAAFIANRITRESNGSARARAAIEAFYRYYQKNPNELSLGLYLFRAQGVQPVGLKPALNRDLNARLAFAFDHIAGAISEAGFDEPDGRAADGVAHATGLLILTAAGRMKVFRSRPDELMIRYLGTAFPETGDSI